jgi:enoyl-CoA hydratase/carnithine racemase
MTQSNLTRESHWRYRRLPMSAEQPTNDLLIERSSGVLRLTINRPERRNAMTWAVVQSMQAAITQAKEDREISVVVLAGAGDEAFCSGADLGSMSHGVPSGGADGAEADLPSFLDQHDSRGQLRTLFEQLWELGKPTIAKVQGWAMAGGFGLALACDMVVCSDRARFGAPEINVGLWPFMITVPMVRSMPPKKALELMLTGRQVDAAEAERIGFVNRVVAHDQLDAAVEELAHNLAGKSPTALRLGRDSFYRVWDMSSGEALSHLHAMLTLINQTEDAKEGMSAFLEKRPPRWQG